MTRSRLLPIGRELGGPPLTVQRRLDAIDAELTAIALRLEQLCPEPAGPPTDRLEHARLLERGEALHDERRRLREGAP